jgi:hypothetical protein
LPYYFFSFSLENLRGVESSAAPLTGKKTKFADETMLCLGEAFFKFRADATFSNLAAT